VSRMYIVRGAATAVTTAVDFLEIAPADDKPVMIHKVIITQKTEVGDAQEEFLEVLAQRGGTAMTSGSGGAAATVNATNPGDPAASFAAEVFNTTRATFTSGVSLHDEAFNERVGFERIWTPETRIVVSQANGGITFGTADTPADSVTCIVTAYVEEIG
jgi:hypothetical protein